MPLSWQLGPQVITLVLSGIIYLYKVFAIWSWLTEVASFSLVFFRGLFERRREKRQLSLVGFSHLIVFHSRCKIIHSASCRHIFKCHNRLMPLSYPYFRMKYKTWTDLEFVNAARHVRSQKSKMLQLTRTLKRATLSLRGSNPRFLSSTLYNVVDEFCRHSGDVDAIFDENGRHSYADISAKSSVVAKALVDEKVFDQNVSYVCPNDASYAFASFGIW